MIQFFNPKYLSKIFVYSFLLLLISSCNNKDISSLEKEELKSEKILLEEIIAPDFITRTGNKLVIASSKSENMLHTYSLPDLKYLYATGRKGSGPDEIKLFPMFCESPNQSLYVWGYDPKTIKKFDINQNGELKFIDLKILPRYEAFNDMHILNDSIIIYYLPDDLRIVKLDLLNNNYLDDIQMKKDDHNESFFYSNRGTIAANNSFVVFGYLFKKQINIYRVSDFKLHKKIIGDYKEEEPRLGDFKTPKYYTQVVAGENFFYALFNDNKSNSVVLEVYDYNGLIVRQFTFDIVPKLFTVDENNSTIYGYGYNDKLEQYLLRYGFGY